MDTNSNPGVSSAIKDGKQIAKDALTGVQKLCDNVLNEVSGEVPKLTGDALTIANDFISKNLSHAGPLAGILVGLLSTTEVAVKQQLDTRSAAFLTIFKTDVDSALGHLTSQV